MRHLRHHVRARVSNDRGHFAGARQRHESLTCIERRSRGGRVRIGIDARELCGRATGVGRYLGGLVREWAADERARSHEFILYTPTTLQLPVDGRRFPARLVAGDGGSWWEQVQMPSVAARDHLDIFFSPGYSTPLFRRVPTVVAIHDVSFAAHPEWFSVREGVRR